MRKVFKCKTCGDINKITYISFASFGESQVAATKKLIGVTPKTMGKSSSVDRAGTLDQKSSAIFSGGIALVSEFHREHGIEMCTDAPGCRLT